jgi:O-antigen/teichoic acid export membrane protein
MWYGVSSIFARLLNYLLTPYLTYKLSGSGYGEMSLVYAAIPFLNVVFTYGMETAYFRFIQKKEHEADLYNTAAISLICSTIFFTGLMLLFRNSIAEVISIKEHPEYITWSAFIIAFDTLAVLPFAKLRQDGRPVKYAFVRVAGILVNIGLTFLFLSVFPKMAVSNPNSVFTVLHDKDLGVSYVIIATLIQSMITLLLLWKEFTSFKWNFNQSLWKEMMIYSLPLLVAGFGGMINETFDRIMLGWWAPVQGATAVRAEVGTYSACYKLSILITLFVQAFRLGAEPFFFKQASGENPQRVYARVMKFFVITICVMFLFVSLFLDIWKHFIKNEHMWVGLKVVPILLLANMFLGIYYNLSVWYKVTNRTMAGAYITLIGAAITLLINYLFIPKYSYMACAWATFFCYGSMMLISFIWGQKEYRIPYAWKKLSAYILIVVLIYFVHHSW